MDSNVEMVEKKRRAVSFDDDGDDVIVAADDLRDHEARGGAPRPAETFSSEITSHPERLFRNQRFLMALLAVILGLAFVIGSFYIENEPVVPSNGEGLSGGEMGENGQQQVAHQAPNANKMSQASGSLPSAKHQGKDWTKHHAASKHTPAENGASDHLNPSEDQVDLQQEVLNWQQATVSLDDGKKYEVVKQMEHDKRAFTEGLTYFDGRLFESIGLNGQSELRELDPETGTVINAFPMEKKYFGEGLTHYNGTLIQLTWQSQTGFLYDVNNLDAPPRTFHFTTTKNEGWGLTYDPDRHELIESDGSANLHIWDPDTLEQLRVVPVTRLSGNAATNMNELEYWRGRILANIWYKDSIIVVDHVTGKVEKEYDFGDLYPKAQRRSDGADVLNGISVSKDPNLLYITGKNWDRMYLIKLLY